MVLSALPERAPDAAGQLYDLAADPGETTNLFSEQAERRERMQSLLAELKSSGRSAPTGRVPLGPAGVAAAVAARGK